MGTPVSVDSKPFTRTNKPFRCNTYEKQGMGPIFARGTDQAGIFLAD
jgi:hypothetical protein